MNVAVLGAGGMGGSVISHLKQSDLVSDIIAQDIRAERPGPPATKRCGSHLAPRSPGRRYGGQSLSALLPVRLTLVTGSTTCRR